MAGTYAEATGCEECEKHLGCQARLRRNGIENWQEGKAASCIPQASRDGFPAVMSLKEQSDLHAPHSQPFVVPSRR